jgi:hypothetical protein
MCDVREAKGLPSRASEVRDGSVRPVLSGGSLGPSDGGSSSGISGSLSAVTATDDGWVAVGINQMRPLLLTSMDARHWAAVAVPGDDGTLFDVAFGGGTLVAVGQSYVLSQILTKTPGGEWHHQSVEGMLHKVVFGNGRFLVSSHADPGGRVSTDGIDWTASIPAQWHGFLDGRFVAFAGRGSLPGPNFRTSADGVTWTDPVAPVGPLSGIGSLAVIDDRIVGFGNYYCQFGSCPSLVWLSGPRGTTLSELQGAAVPPLLGEGRDGGNVPDSPPGTIASNEANMVAISLEGEIWSAPLTTSPPARSPSWVVRSVAGAQLMADVAYARGMFVAVGQTVGEPKALIATSTDGTTWQAVEL